MNLKYSLLSLRCHAFIVIFTFQYLILTHIYREKKYSFFLHNSAVLSHCMFDKMYSLMISCPPCFILYIFLLFLSSTNGIRKDYMMMAS